MKMNKQQSAAVELVKPLSYDGTAISWEGVVHCETLGEVLGGPAVAVAVAVATNGAMMGVARMPANGFVDGDIDLDRTPFPTSWHEKELGALDAVVHRLDGTEPIRAEMARLESLDNHLLPLCVDIPGEHTVLVNARYMAKALECFTADPAVLIGGPLDPVILESTPPDSGMVAMRVLIMPVCPGGDNCQCEDKHDSVVLEGRE